ncbi:MAG: amidohydrolase family protein [Eubacteriales bacterium]|nr:amidohydrolase family protein [Eubacteriales bacterium]
MFGECHAHVIMDGINYKKAVGLHAEGVQDKVVRRHLEAYRDADVHFVRDGGDAFGVSKRAKRLAVEYGIDYRTPIFAIHKEGHYGAIVGRSFGNLQEFHARVLEAREEGADFIKIMTTGLLDFANHGTVTGTPLDVQEVKEMVHIAHEEGFAVMSHTNGVYGVRAALEAGVDSIEHGNYMDEATVRMLAETNTVWVPTLVTVRNLRGCGRYEDSVISPIMEHAAANLRLAWKSGAKVALGSDAGAYRVLHGKGIQDELAAFREVLGESREILSWLEEGENKIKERFQRK